MSTVDPRSPFRRRGFRVAAAAIGLIALLAAVAVIAGVVGGSGDGAESTPAPIDTPSTSTAEVDGDPSVCGLEGYETTSSLKTAPDNAWELVGTVAAPTNPAAGPGVIDDDGFRTCYAHTAEGALFAAANAGALGSDATFAPRMYELAAPGPGRDTAQQQSSTPRTATTTRIQYAGFSVLAYDGQTATIDLAINRASDGQLISLPVKLEWAEGDWKLVVTDEGQQPLSPAAIDSLGGYIAWSGA